MSIDIVIGNYRFILISKTVKDDKAYINTDPYIYSKRPGFIENRDKIYFISVNLENGEEKELYAYTSLSELGCWRLCFLNPEEFNALNKFNGYTQSTILHLELQKFIYLHYDTLPYTDADKTRTSKVSSHQKHLLGITTRDELLIKYLPDINIHGAINCKLPTTEEDEYIRSRMQLLFSNNSDTISPIEHSVFIEDNYEFMGKTEIMTYSGSFENINFIHNIYEIKLQAKIPEYKNMILHIGQCDITVIPTGEIRIGYYVLNIIPSEAIIDKYGLYNEYYFGATYVSKPLNYIIQPPSDNYKFYSRNSIKELEEILSKRYIFTAYQNNDLFPIKNIISDSFLNKYLKYKKKYLLLKNNNLLS